MKILHILALVFLSSCASREIASQYRPKIEAAETKSLSLKHIDGPYFFVNHPLLSQLKKYGDKGEWTDRRQWRTYGAMLTHVEGNYPLSTNESVLECIDKAKEKQAAFFKSLSDSRYSYVPDPKRPVFNERVQSESFKEFCQRTAHNEMVGKLSDADKLNLQAQYRNEALILRSSMSNEIAAAQLQTSMALSNMSNTFGQIQTTNKLNQIQTQNNHQQFQMQQIRNTQLNGR